jgi:spoIIIJ-associated protein
MSYQRLQTITEEFLKDSGISKTCDFSYDEKLNILWCNIDTDHGRALVYRNAEGMQALNYVLRKVIEKSLGEENGSPTTSVIIDIFNTEKKRIENLRNMAHMMAERARYFKSSIDVDPMSPYDRRIVHEYVSTTMPDLSTESVGEGRDRHIVIKYKGESNSI